MYLKNNEIIVKKTVYTEWPKEKNKYRYIYLRNNVIVKKHFIQSGTKRKLNVPAMDGWWCVNFLKIETIILCS